MFTLKLKNENNEVVELTHNSNYTITEITGLNPSKATINTNDLALLDGARFNSAKINQRNIVITMKINQPVETNRINLYKYCIPKKSIKLLYENSTRSVYIDGYIESVDCNFFSNLETMQISIICPKPFFIDSTTTTINFTDNLTQTFTNSGDIECGGIFTIKCGNITGKPIISNNRGESFTINYAFRENDEIIIDMRDGNKSVMLLRDDEYINILNRIDLSSKWFKLTTGSNTISISVTTGANDVECMLEYNKYYIGV